MLKPKRLRFQSRLKERVVIERVTPTDAGRAVAPGSAAFRKGSGTRRTEERLTFTKAFVREEVKVTKVVEQETVEAQETLRREELDVDSGSTVDTSELPKDRKHS